MLRIPKTVGEAKAIRYGCWAGRPSGSAYNPEQCAWKVWSHNGCQSYQCTRKNGHGDKGLFCKQHAKRVPHE